MHLYSLTLSQTSQIVTGLYLDTQMPSCFNAMPTSHPLNRTPPQPFRGWLSLVLDCWVWEYSEGDSSSSRFARQTHQENLHPVRAAQRSSLLQRFRTIWKYGDCPRVRRLWNVEGNMGTALTFSNLGPLSYPHLTEKRGGCPHISEPSTAAYTSQTPDPARKPAQHPARPAARS